MDTTTQEFGESKGKADKPEAVLGSIKYKTTEYLLADSVAEFIEKRRRALEQLEWPGVKR